MVLPNLRLSHLRALKNLNWTARKYALYASFVGESRYCCVESPSSDKKSILYKLEYCKSTVLAGVGSKKGTKSKTSGGGSGTVCSLKSTSMVGSIAAKEQLQHQVKVPKNNILAHLRCRGFEDLVRVVIGFI